MEKNVKGFLFVFLIYATKREEKQGKRSTNTNGLVISECICVSI